MPSSAREYRLRPLAEDDLENIWLYTFKNWSMEQADLYIRDIIENLEDLAAGRKTGRAVDICDGYFKHAVGAHFVFYRVTGSVLDIVRVLHPRMDVGRHL